MTRTVESRAEWEAVVRDERSATARLKFCRYIDSEDGFRFRLRMSVYQEDGMYPRVPLYELRGDWVRDLADEMRREELRDRDARDIEAAWSICRERAGAGALLMSTDGHLAVLRGIQHGREDP